MLLAAAGLFTAVEPAAAAGSRLPADGSFVSYYGRVYSVVGRSLLPVRSWAPFGGPRRSVAITDKQFAAARPLPVNGSFARSLPDNRVYEFVGGVPVYVSSWAVLGGVKHYADVDGRTINTYKSKVGLDGGFVRSAQDGRIFQFVFGAPIYVSSWAPYGGPRPVVTIDGNAIVHAGQGPWSSVRRYPPNGSALVGATRPGAPMYLYVVTGGAPVFLPTTKNLPADALLDRVRVDERSMSNAGGAYPYDRLRAQPSDGVFLFGWKSFDPYTLTGDGKVYWLHDGSAIPVANDKACNSRMTLTNKSFTDDSTVQMAGTGGRYNHLAKVAPNHPAPPC